MFRAALFIAKNWEVLQCPTRREGMKITATWMKLKMIIFLKDDILSLVKESRHKAYKLYDSIYMKFQNMQS